MNNKLKFQLFFITIFLTFLSFSAYGGIAKKTSAPFTLDTRDLNPTPDNGWQVISNLGNTYNEDIVIDNYGKVWVFYYETEGANQPVYMKIFKSDAHLYLYRTKVGHSSFETEPRLNPIRAELNANTGDVWVALQGDDGAYFVIFDSTGQVKRDSTLIAANAFLPKLAIDSDGKVWFSWHTSNHNRSQSQAMFATYNSAGDIIYEPKPVSDKLYVFNTDIAIDDSERVWVEFEINENNDFSTVLNIYDNNGEPYKTENIISTNELILNTKRTFFSDKINQRMWLMEKNNDFDFHNLHLFSLDGSKITTLQEIGTSAFIRNELNQIEVVRFNHSDPENKIYEAAKYNPYTGEMITSWQALYDSTYQFVQHCVAYNRNEKTLKVYLVNQAEKLTRMKFLTVETGFPRIAVTPTSINFDTTKIKTGYAKVREISITNTGNEVLHVEDINPQNSQFSVTDTAFSLLPNQYKTVEIRFFPTDTNVVNSTVEIVSDDQSNNPFSISVSGRGYMPTQPEIVVSPSTLIFDEVVIGSQQSLFVYVQNNDKYEPLQISSITHADTQFTIDKSEFSVLPRQGQYVNVVFSPVIAAELITDSLIIHSNDPDTSDFIVPIFASSRAPLKPEIGVSPDSIYFGEVAVGEEKTIELTVTNRGEALLQISAVNSDNAQFTVDSTEFAVTAQNTKIIHVTFAPQNEGEVSAHLTIISNDENNQEFTIPLVGVGKVLSAPYLVYDKTELNFGKIQQGDTLQKFILLQNFGDRTLKVFNFYNNDTTFQILASDTIRIEKEQSYYLWVKFAPQDTMQHNDALNFATNDPNNQFVEINLVGKGEPNEQQLIVSFHELNFGSVLIHSQAKDSLLVSNTGNRTLTVSNILSTNTHFRPNVTFFTISPQQTKKVYIYFRPDSIKQFTGKLSIVSNDPVADSIFVQLSGNGRDSTDQHIILTSKELEFGEVAKNNTKIMSLVINNSGERKLEITDIFSSLPVFSPTQTDLTILGNSFQTIYVNFEPTESVQYIDTLKIVSNDPESDTSFVFLSGKGREPLAQKIAISDTVLDFGAVAFGRNITKYLHIYNTGERNLSVFNVSVSDSQFQIPQDWFILEPGENKNLAITFSPTSEMQATAYLILQSNDPKNSQVSVTLYGKGTIYQGPEVAIDPDNLNFGSTYIGAQKQLSFKIYNRSQYSTLNITDYSLSNSTFKIIQMPNAVQRSDSSYIRVAYQPSQTGYHYGSLTIFTNDAYNEQIYLNLTGIGVNDFPAQNTLSALGWISNGSTPFGDGFSIFGTTYTADMLGNKNEKALFIKDIYLYENPSSDGTFMNLSFKNGITVIINSTIAFDSTDTNLKYWNKTNLDVSQFLTLGRNRIAVVVRTGNSPGSGGGFDCEMFVNNQPKIRRGDQNWNQPDALWWYFYPVPSIPTDNVNDRLWFASDYALDFADSIKANWSFEPTGGDTIYDSSVFAKPAILHNIEWTDGIVGKAIQFSGNDNSYAEIGTNLNELPLNIEMWLKCYDARSYRQTVFSNKTGESSDGNGLFITPDMQLGVYFYNGEYVFPNFTLESDAWHLVSVQYGFAVDAGLNYVTVFVDGDSVGFYNYQPNYPNGPANRFYIGGVPQIQSDAFYGAIDELVLKNKVSGAPPIANVAMVSFNRSSDIITRSDTTLSFQITPTPFKILSGKLTLFHGGETFSATTAYVDTNFWTHDSLYSSAVTVDIPNQYLDVRGLYFAISLRTNWGEIHYPDQGLEFLRYQTTVEASNLTLNRKLYRMISIPYELKEKSVPKVLENYGNYDPYRWRLFDWEQQDTTYVEFSDTTQDQRWKFERGKAFWLVTDGEKDFVGGAGVTPQDEDYRIILKPGWNMVGNPFPYTIPFSMMTAPDGSYLQGPFYYQSSDSIGWLPPEKVTYCKPWEGYFIWNSDSVNQTIIVPGVVDDQNFVLPKPLSEKQYFAQKYPDASFIIDATAVCGKYFDRGNLFGAAKKANNEFDSYDSPELPEISNYVSLWVDNFGWPQKRGAYRTDFQHAGENGYCWRLVLDCQVPGAKFVSLVFREIKDVPDDWQIYLFDTDEDIAYHLNSSKNLKLPISTNDGMIKHFKLVVGDDQYIQQNSDQIPLVPVEFALRQNYPNPFNGLTTIEFSLPRRMNVKIKIYNILGQTVKTLVDGFVRGGIHQLRWDGTNNVGQFVPSGMYFVKIIGEQKTTDVKKILLLK